MSGAETVGIFCSKPGQIGFGVPFLGILIDPRSIAADADYLYINMVMALVWFK